MFKQKGFTVTELLIAVGVIGVMSAIIAPTFGAMMTARENAYRTKHEYNNQLIGESLLRYAEKYDPLGRLPLPYSQNGSANAIYNPSGVSHQDVVLREILHSSGINYSEIKWVRLETRERFGREFARNSERISRLANKFIEYRNSSNDFPKKLRDGGLLGAGERVKISDLIGYVGAAHGCSGVFFYESIPLDCTDIFNEWGSDNFYEYVDTEKIIFSSESRVLNGSGEPIVFIREFSN